MKALLLTQYKQLEVADVPPPDIGPDDVLVRVRACGICGSDIHGYDGSSGRRIPPLVMGHEAAGEVAEVGASVTGLRVGMPVTFDSMVSCGRCHFCRRGQTNLCDNRRVLGVSCAEYRRHGAFAEYVAVPQHIVFPLPETLSPEQAAMVEPVSVAVHAANRTPVRLDDSAVVVGTGMIGLLVVQTLRLRGCGKIMAVDLDEDKLKLARQLARTWRSTCAARASATGCLRRPAAEGRISRSRSWAPRRRWPPRSKRCAKAARSRWWVT